MMPSASESTLDRSNYCRLTPTAERAATLLVLESDIGQPPEYWQYLVDRLVEQNVQCLVHIRPGYTWRPSGDAIRLGSESVDRLVADADRVVYLAHSLGALLTLVDSSTGSSHGRTPDAAVLLDPVTPRMVSDLRSNEFELGRVRRGVDISVASAGLGFSRFSAPIERAYQSYPQPVQKRCKAFRNNFRNALTARREFNFVVDHDLPIAPLGKSSRTLLIHSEFAIPAADQYAASQRELADQLDLESSAIIRIPSSRLKTSLSSPIATADIAAAVVEFVNNAHVREDAQ